MKKRPSASPRKETATQKTSSAAKPKVRPLSTPRRSSEATPLDVITIMPPESDEPPLSSTSLDLQRVRFGYFQPDAQEVFVAGSFNNWNPRATPMKRDALGDWSVEVRLPPGEYRYRFLVDGDWRDDPSAQLTAMNSYGGFDAVVVV